MTTAFIFTITLVILGVVLYRLERNRPGGLQTTHLHGDSGIVDRDIGRLETEMQAIVDQRHGRSTRWISPSRNLALGSRPWHLSLTPVTVAAPSTTTARRGRSLGIDRDVI